MEFCTWLPLPFKMAARVLCKLYDSHLGIWGSPSANWVIMLNMFKLQEISDVNGRIYSVFYSEEMTSHLKFPMISRQNIFPLSSMLYLVQLPEHVISCQSRDTNNYHMWELCNIFDLLRPQHSWERQHNTVQYTRDYWTMPYTNWQTWKRIRIKKFISYTNCRCRLYVP